MGTRNHFADPGIRFTDPNYYGHWKYMALPQNIDPPLPGNNPDFFQIIDYAMNQAIGVPLTLLITCVTRSLSEQR